MTDQQTMTTGCVKWFNNKAGYGFITVTDETPRDIFVHHSAIQVSETQYKYLVQGEYVDFSIARMEGENHEFQAAGVHGVRGGKLMCETRNEMRGLRDEQQTPTQQTQQRSTQNVQRSTQNVQRSTQSVQQSAPRQETRRPQLSKNDQSEWMIVPRRKFEQQQQQQQQQPVRETQQTRQTSKTTRPRQRQPVVELSN